MPRRSGRSGGMARAPMQRAPAPPPMRSAPPSVPAHAPPSAPMAPQPKQPGMFAQMATTAAGVAVGSAVGHTIGHAMTGSLGGGGGAQEAAPAAVAPPAASTLAPPPAVPSSFQQPGFDATNPCRMQLQQFIECTQTQSDITLCTGFNDALKECRLYYGVS